ncbi:hypothetical protein ACF046_00175 [Glutamicibacter creatinolyticus]|uniref:hypothetical protein n=1 Tax=Glutamicibacter creatinolyticus TaxID=162496 RepID=UPI0033CEE97B
MMGEGTWRKLAGQKYEEMRVEKFEFNLQQVSQGDEVCVDGVCFVPPAQPAGQDGDGQKPQSGSSDS